MVRWLFNSSGEGIAFIVGKNVFDQNIKFLGKLEGNEIWNGEYVAEIIKDDRIARKTIPLLTLKDLPGLPGLPDLPGLPGLKGMTVFPVGYEDLDI